MSIIQEALEKAQVSLKPAVKDEKEKNTAKIDKTAETEMPAAKKIYPARGAFSKAMPVLSLIALASGMAFLGLKFLSHESRLTIPNKSIQDASYRPITENDTLASTTLAGSIQKSIAPRLLKPLSSPDLTLDGIMYLDDGPRAIINNNITAVGDTVSGAKVVKINDKSVILEYGDVEITLNLK